MKDVIRWGILGPGRIALRFARTLMLTPGAQVTAIASRSAERSLSFAKQFNVDEKRAYDSYEKLANDPDVDIVYIATPHNFHAEQAILMMEHGKAILCEKPLVATHAQAVAMIEASRRNKVFLMEAIWSHFVPAWQQALRHVADGDIGDVRYFNAVAAWSLPEVDLSNRLFDPALAGGGLLDAGPYTFSPMLEAMGGQDVKEIHAMAEMTPEHIDINLLISVKFQNDALASMFNSLMTSQSGIRIAGRSGLIDLPGSSADYLTLRVPGKPARRYNFPFVREVFVGEILEAQRCLREGLLESPELPLSHSLKIAALYDQVAQQIGMQFTF